MSFDDYPDLGSSNFELEPMNEIDDEDLLNFFLSGDNLGGLISPDPAQMHSSSSSSSSSSSASSSSVIDTDHGGLLSNPPSLSAPLTPRSDGGMSDDMMTGGSGILGGGVGSGTSSAGNSSLMRPSASSQIISSLGQVNLDGGTSSGQIFLGGGFGGFGGHLGTANEVNDPKSSRKFNTNHNGGKIPKTSKSLNLHGKTASVDDEEGEDSGEEGSVEDKKKRRLSRNRESARQSRRRKKQYLELLEDKVEQLTQEVNLLRQKRLEQAAKELHQQWQAKVASLEPVADALTAELERLKTQKGEVMQPQVQDGFVKLDRQLRLAKTRFGPNSAEYLKILNHHFDLMKQILLPPYTRFLLWAMDQGDEFFKGGSQRNRGRIKSQSNVTSKVIPGSGAANLWPLVWNELGLTYEQEEKTKATFAGLNTEENIQARRELVVAMNLMDRIHRVALVHGAGMQSMADRVSNVLTPSQQVRFFAWYERNRKRIHDCGMDRGLSKTGNPNNRLQGLSFCNSLAELTERPICGVMEASDTLFFFYFFSFLSFFFSLLPFQPLHQESYHYQTKI
jgi:hypothetical protein